MSEENAILAQLRGSCPVTTLRPGVHFVVRYEDVAAVLSDHESFSGARPSTLRRLRPDEDLSLLEMDGPRHSTMRRIVLAAIPRDLVAHVEPDLATICRERLEALVPARRAELISELIEPAAKAIVAIVIGLPEGDRVRVYQWAADLKDHEGTSPPTQESRFVPAPAARKEFDRWILEESRRRRAAANPPDDVFTRLLETRNDRGESLTEAEFAAQIRFLAQAGIGSMVRLTGNLLYELSRVPERYSRVRADRTLIPVAIDESLRHDPPGDYVARTCVRETTVGETRIRPGDQVILSITSAHRDEVCFDNGDEFDLNRGRFPNHLAFGRGRHRCPGASLAGMFASLVLSSLLDRIWAIRLAPGFSYDSVSFSARGPRRLDIEFEA